MKIGIAQMNSQDNKSRNLRQAEELIDCLAGRGAEFVLLPECFNFLGPENDMAQSSESMEGESQARIRGKAREHKIHLHSGSFLESEKGRVYNTSVVYDPDGNIIAKYRKIFLFDVETPGGFIYKESSVITPGGDAVTFKAGGITFGMSICYDLRFPELYRRLMKSHVQVFLVPAAFTLQTGRDHWELLLRARAVENLSWVVSSAQWGPHPPNFTCYGRSMVVNPWGLVVAQAPDGVSCLIAEIDLEQVRQTRTAFPALRHTREDIFPS